VLINILTFYHSIIPSVDFFSSTVIGIILLCVLFSLIFFFPQISEYINYTFFTLSQDSVARKINTNYHFLIVHWSMCLLSIFLLSAELIIFLRIQDGQVLGLSINKLFLWIAICLLFFLILKYCILVLIDYVSKQDISFKSNNLLLNILLIINSLFLSICLPFSFFFPSGSYILIIYIMIITFIITMIIYLVMLYKRIMSSHVSLFYCFLYLCTLEIMPTLILFRLFEKIQII